MKFASIEWSLGIDTRYPLLRICGVPRTPVDEQTLITTALDFIEKSEKFNGIIWNNHKIPENQNTPIMVSFTLKFQTHRDIHDFINFIRYYKPK